MNGRSNVSLHGNITKDIEQRTTTSGVNIANFTVAINHPKDEVSFIDCVAFGQPAEFLTKYVEKGQKIYVEGSLKQNKWQDKQGNNRSNIEVIARQVDVLSKSEDRPLKQHEVVAESYKDNLPSDDEVTEISLKDIPF